MTHIRQTRQAHWRNLYGIFAVVWGIAAWAEWFVTPMIVPNHGGPVPYITYAPLTIALFCGCCWLVVSLFVLSPQLSHSQRLLYAVTPGSYIFYQIASAVS